MSTANKPFKSRLKYVALAGACLAIGILNMPGFADDEPLQDLKILEPYAFARPASASAGAAFMAFKNQSDHDLVITGASSLVSDVTELHTHIHEDGVMQMRPVESFTLPAGAIHSLSPAGDHIMLIDLKMPLEANTTFPVTLEFSDGNTKTVEVKVVSPGGALHSQPIVSDEKHDMHNHDHGK